MKTSRPLAASMPFLVLLFALTSSAYAQSITFFEVEGFGGRQISSDQSIPNFDPLGMNDAANSVIVRSGQWQICVDAYFQGRCVTLAPGEYPNLGAFDMRNSVSSARLIGAGDSNVIPAPVIAAPLPSQAPQYQPPQYQPPQYQPAPSRRAQLPPVLLYDQYDFSGNSMPVSAQIDNLASTQWNDRAVSMVINQGNWQLCSDAYYRGSCTVFGPGSYRDLGNDLVRRLSSLRPVDNGVGYIPAPPIAAPQPDYPQGARALLFSDHDLRGANMVIDGDVPNLDGSGFNDRASSIRVESGYWMFCIDAGYGGDCRIFGPGDYPSLPDGFDRRISSVRRVAGPGR